LTGDNTERGIEEERRLFGPGNEERACEVRNPEGARAPTGFNRSGGEKGYGCHGGRKPLKRRIEAEKVSVESAGAERWDGNVLPIAVREESFERGSPGA